MQRASEQRQARGALRFGSVAVGAGAPGVQRWSNRLFNVRASRVKIANYGGFAQDLRLSAQEASVSKRADRTQECIRSQKQATHFYRS